MIKIITIPVTPFGQNARVLIDLETDEVIIVDPGGEVPKIMSIMESEGLLSSRYSHSKVILTHSHVDHGGGVEDYMTMIEEKLSQKPALLFHKDNDLYRETISNIASMYGLPESEFKNVPPSDAYLNDDEKITLGDYEIQALFTPGHAPGHLSFYFPHISAEEEIRNQGGSVVTRNSISGPLLIGGDALFSGSIGRTDLPGGNHDQLIASIRTKLLVLPDETIVLSGHGPNTSIEVEKRSNPFLQ
jgi:hydroxyacylglutathione hydrolase